MFGLLYGLYQYLVQRPEYYVLIIGLDNAGKTTLLERIKALFVDAYQSAPPSSIAPTVGLNIGRMEVNRSQIIFWDLVLTGGQSGLRSIWERYYPAFAGHGMCFRSVLVVTHARVETHAIIYVVDSSDASRIPEAKEAFETVLQNPQLANLPILVVSNKHDLPETQDLRHLFDPSSSPTLHPFRVQDVCALSGDGVREGVEWITSNLRPRNRDENV